MKLLLYITLFLLGGTTLATDQVRATKVFDSIKIDGPFKAVISTDKTAALTVTGDDEILPWVVSNVKNGRLVISMKPGVRPHYSQQVELKIKTPGLTAITASNHASIQANGLKADKLSIGLENHSSLKGEAASIKQTTTLTLVNHSEAQLEGATNQLTLAANNHSQANIDDLDAQNASINLVNHSTAMVSSKNVVTNESNHASLTLSEGLKKITGHLQDHSTIDAPKEDTIQSFINDDSEFGGAA